MDGRRTRRFVEMAINKAYESDSFKRHGCVLVKSGKARAASCNTGLRSTIAGRAMPNVHAEMGALHLAFRSLSSRHNRRARKNHNHHMDVYVIRIGYNGDLLNSRPCLDCIRALKKFQVERVYYSDALGQIKMEKLAEMQEGHQSFHQTNHHTCDYPVQRILRRGHFAPPLTP